MPGITTRRLSTDFKHLRIHYLADPEKGGDWADRESVRYGGRDAPKWRREQEIDYKAYMGQRVWPMLSPVYHNTIIPMTDDWSVFRVIDSGVRHPTVCLWLMINRRGDRHVFREYYSTDRSIALNCAEISRITHEQVTTTLIDPETRKRSRESLTPFVQIYEDNGIPCQFADNSRTGYDTVSNFLLSAMARQAIATGVMPKTLGNIGANKDQLLLLAEKPSLTFDLRFTPRSFQECQNLRWQELTGDPTQKAAPEKVMDKDKDGPDCVRYAVQTEMGYIHPVKRNEPGSYADILAKRRLRRRDSRHAVA